MRIQISISAAIPTISLSEAVDRGYFGPVYHGTTIDRKTKIDDEGFFVFVGDSGSGMIRNGYSDNLNSYPVHTLGYGIYFTQSKSIASKFALGSKKLDTYYLDVPRIQTINFASPNTIAKWWAKNGFDYKLAQTDRVAATVAMTKVLSSQYDAVLQKAKMVGKSGFDGNQIVVFDTSRIFKIDPALNIGYSLGAKVRRNSDGMLGIIKNKRVLNVQESCNMLRNRIAEITPESECYERLNTRLAKYKKLLNGSNDTHYTFDITWKKGGTTCDNTILDFETIGG